jgi:hypothetical protein
MTKKGNAPKHNGIVQLQNLPRGIFHREQYRRILRYYERLKTIYDGRQKGAKFEYQDDDMLAFFMNCHHLKDWIIQDFYVDDSHPDHAKYSAMVSRLSDEVDRFVDSHDCLKLCADICNGAKHLRRLEPLHFGETIKVRTEVHIDDKDDHPSVKRVWKIISASGKEWDALDLATDCVKKWTSFLKDHEEMFQEMIGRQEERNTKCVADVSSETCNPIRSSRIIGVRKEKPLEYHVIPKKD